MSVNRNNKLVLLHEKIERRSAGDIIYRTYACPCGRGTIEEEQDYTEGHRDWIAFLKCKFCEDRYFIDFGNSEINWKISERNIPSAITGRKNKTNFIGGKKMITTLDDFTREYTKIKAMGWVKTHRSGPTGIGKTLEDLLGIVENNIDGPDFGDYELKSCRLNSNSMLTIFTKTPQPQGAASTLRMKFGYSSEAYDNDEKVLHSTLSADRFVSIANTGHSLKVSCDETKISIVAEDGREYAYWTRDQLKKAFEKKYKGKFVYAKAQSRGNGESEEFSFIEAYEVSGFNYDAFVSLLEQGKIYIDLRIGQYHGGAKDGQTHDHGTGFRIKENDQHLLFRVNRRIV